MGTIVWKAFLWLEHRARARARWWAHEGRWRWAPRRTLGGATSIWEEEGGGNAIRRVGTRGRRRQGRAGVPACRRAGVQRALRATRPSHQGSVWSVVSHMHAPTPASAMRVSAGALLPIQLACAGPRPWCERVGRAGGQASSSTREPLTVHIPDQQDGSKITEGTASARGDRCWRTWY